MKIEQKIGNENLLNLQKTAFLCSRKVPASVVLKCYDWAIEQRNSGNCIISGFHSQIEKDVFHFLLKGKQPIIIALARGMKTRFEPEIKKAIDAGRLLIISPFESNVIKNTSENAIIRNKLMIELSDEVVIGHKQPGGMLDKLLAEYADKRIAFI